MDLICRFVGFGSISQPGIELRCILTYRSSLLLLLLLEVLDPGYWTWCGTKNQQPNGSTKDTKYPRNCRCRWMLLLLLLLLLNTCWRIVQLKMLMSVVGIGIEIQIEIEIQTNNEWMFEWMDEWMRKCCAKLKPVCMRRGWLMDTGYWMLPPAAGCSKFPKLWGIWLLAFGCNLFPRTDCEVWGLCVDSENEAGWTEKVEVGCNDVVIG